MRLQPGESRRRGVVQRHSKLIFLHGPEEFAFRAGDVDSETADQRQQTLAGVHLVCPELLRVDILRIDLHADGACRPADVSPHEQEIGEELRRDRNRVRIEPEAGHVGRIPENHRILFVHGDRRSVSGQQIEILKCRVGSDFKCLFISITVPEGVVVFGDHHRLPELAYGGEFPEEVVAPGEGAFGDQSGPGLHPVGRMGEIVVQDDIIQISAQQVVMVKFVVVVLGEESAVSQRPEGIAVEPGHILLHFAEEEMAMVLTGHTLSLDVFPVREFIPELVHTP